MHNELRDLFIRCRFRILGSAIMMPLILAGCATIHPAQRGINLMNAGQHQAAYNTLVACAQQGEPACINNVGVMYERGFMQGGPDTRTAIQYYHLAARYGLAAAQQNLRTHGAAVPAPDLQAAYLQQQYQTQQAYAELGYQLGCALGGGCTQPTPPRRQQPRAAQQWQQWQQPLPQPQAPAKQSRQTDPSGCNSDLECGVGNRCVRPAGTFGRGQCVTPVDEHGLRDYSRPGPSVGPRDVSSCQFNTDCPVGFRCEKDGSQLYGLCVK